MSDSSISIVPRLSAFPNKENKAKEILDWLIGRDIVKSKSSDCVLGSNLGYAVSEGAKLITNETAYLPFGLENNGLDLILDRQIFHTGQHGLDHILCPNCDTDISPEASNIFTQWADDKMNSLPCPHCSTKSNIHQFNFSPTWGFSDLGFTFWNWPDFTTQFIGEFQDKLGCKIDLVYATI